MDTVYLGSYSADGKFRTESERLYKLRVANPGTGQLTAPPLPADSSERVVADYEPPAHASRPLKSHSALANFRDALITFAYGHAVLLHAPTHVITDSRGRLIVSDPNRYSVHVIEPAGRNSFRIEGAPDRRLHAPTGIAVDDKDNIYIADGERGFLLVYDPDGHFVRYIGNFHGESLFEDPVAIAIDRTTARLYVVDRSVNELVMLDLTGRILKRVGGMRDRQGKVTLDTPSEIAVRDQRVVIIDANGSRVQVFDLECNQVAAFEIQYLNRRNRLRDMGLALDSSANIYVSNLAGSAIRVFRPDGHPIANLGHFGNDRDGFNFPAGAWIDSDDRIYIADTNNNRVQVYRRIAKTEPVHVNSVSTAGTQ